MRSKICIIIPSFNLIDKLHLCLRSIVKTKYKIEEIVIVDDGSKPQIRKSTLKIITSGIPLTIIRNPISLGFAKSINRGILYGIKKYKETDLDYFLLLNNDAYMHHDFFSKSQPFLAKDYDLMSPIILEKKSGQIDSAGMDYYNDATAVNREKYTKRPYLLTAACLFVSYKFALSCMQEFGWLFIPDFVSYGEDVELSLRALLLSRKLQIIPYKIVDHDRSSTMKDNEKAYYYGARNRLWTVLTTWTFHMIMTNIFGLIKGQAIYAIIYTIKFRNFFVLKLYFDSLLGFPRLFAIRKLIQKNIIDRKKIGKLHPQPYSFWDLIKRSRTYRLLNIKI